MNLQIISNINYPIGNIINYELQNSSETRIAVAFMKFSGIKKIENSLMQCLQKKSSVEIIVGLDFKTTDPKSMLYLIGLKKDYQNLSFFCFGDRNKNKTNIVFHPKIYLFSNNNEKTAIIGSTNLTNGGLITNFEVNTIIREKKPQYFSQLVAIYNSVKFTESIFAPDNDYIIGYSEVYNAFLKNESIAKKDKGVKKVIREIKRKEEELPGTVPTMKQMIIEAIKEISNNQNDYVDLKLIGDYVLEKINYLNLNYSMVNYRQILRKTIYFDLVGYNYKYNKQLFVTKDKYTGLYKLSEKGMNYKGR